MARYLLALVSMRFSMRITSWVVPLLCLGSMAAAASKLKGPGDMGKKPLEKVPEISVRRWVGRLSALFPGIEETTASLRKGILKVTAHYNNVGEAPDNIFNREYGPGGKKRIVIHAKIRNNRLTLLDAVDHGIDMVKIDGVKDIRFTEAMINSDVFDKTVERETVERETADAQKWAKKLRTHLFPNMEPTTAILKDGILQVTARYNFTGDGPKSDYNRDYRADGEHGISIRARITDDRIKLMEVLDDGIDLIKLDKKMDGYRIPMAVYEMNRPAPPQP